jgi:peptidoglycan/xylan/chitin deacetylase (PgdA/CDA1 family)
MPTVRQPGLDHALYDDAPLPTRATLPPMQGKRILVYLALQLEHWELQPPEGSLRDPRFKGEFGSFSPEFRTWTVRDYGNRVGVYRVLALLDALQLQPTVALGAALVQTHPELVALVRERRWEVVAHGFSANRMISSRMSEAEERGFIHECREALVSALQRAPRGLSSGCGARSRARRSTTGTK